MDYSVSVYLIERSECMNIVSNSSYDHDLL